MAQSVDSPVKSAGEGNEGVDPPLPQPDGLSGCTGTPPLSPHREHGSETRPRSGLRMRARDRWGRFSKPELRGFFVWGAVALIVAIPEVWGSIGNPWFYSISRTTGHLEDLWSGGRGIVVALIAVAAVHAVIYRPDMDDIPPERKQSQLLPGRSVKRTRYGRLTISEAPGDDFSDKAALSYLAASVVIVTVAGWLAAATLDDPYWRCYAIYGLITVFFVIIPNAVTFFGGREILCTTLFATVRSLEKTRAAVTMIIMAGLAVLIFHLALYPWPDIQLLHVR
jgi:hypothetical protein